MNVLVLGGTQFIGPFAVQHLIAAGHSVTVFHRGLSEPDLPSDVRHIHGDRSDLPRFRGQLRASRPDVVVDLRCMVEADARAVMDVFLGYVGRAVVISSMDVYRAYDVLRERDRNLQPVPLSEMDELRTNLFPYRGEEKHPDDHPERWQDDYDKILVERAFLEQSALPSTVLRLPAVYGPGDRQHRLRDVAQRLADNRHVMVIDEDSARWRFTHGYVENVAEAITVTATTEVSSGVYNVGEEETPTREEWLRRVFTAVGWNCDVVVVPPELFPDNLRIKGLNLRQDMLADTVKIRRDLGISESVDWDAGIRRTIEWEVAELSRDLDPPTVDYDAEDRALVGLPRRNRHHAVRM